MRQWERGEEHNVVFNHRAINICSVCVFVIIDNKKNTYLFFDKSSSCIAPLSFVSSFEMDAMANHLSLFLLIFFFLSSMTSFFCL